MTVVRRVYVISDLHIGGIYPDDDAPHPARRRGFRMMTRVAELAGFIRHLAQLPASPAVELVINGDFIDFLAEEKGAGGGKIDPTEPPEWTAFRARQGEALDAFREVVRRDGELFAALRALLAAGKRLTLVLGNHDLELCLPDVRAALEAELGPGSLKFLDDGQAYDLGEVLVDHGNLFDPANAVDHDRLRLFRALYSRGWFEDLAKLFSPPAGSKLVARVMNPIKVDYGFIDLLKPQSETLLALLLAIEPGYRNVLDDTATALATAAKTLVPRRGVPFVLRNVGDRDDSPASGGLTNVSGAADADEASALDALVAGVIADATAAQALQQAGKGQTGHLNVAGGWRSRWSLFRLLTGKEDGDLDSRIPQLQATLRALDGDQAFVRGSENHRYLDAAAWLAARGPDQKGYQAVVFGHTHRAKALAIPGTQARYFNTGTWANLMRFPSVFTDVTVTAADVRAELYAFAKQLEQNELDEHLVFEPTYVRLDLGDRGELVHAELCDYDWRADKL